MKFFPFRQTRRLPGFALLGASVRDVRVRTAKEASTPSADAGGFREFARSWNSRWRTC